MIGDGAPAPANSLTGELIMGNSSNCLEMEPRTHVESSVSFLFLSEHVSSRSTRPLAK